MKHQTSDVVSSRGSSSSPPQADPPPAEATPLDVNDSNPKYDCKDEMEKIHLSLMAPVYHSLCALGLKAEAVQSACECEARRLSKQLESNLESYAVKRAETAKVSPQRLTEQFLSMDGPERLKLPRTSSILESILQNRPHFEKKLFKECYDILLVKTLAASKKFEAFGIRPEIAQVIAEDEAGRQLEKLIGNFKKYGLGRAKTTNVKKATYVRIFCEIADQAGVFESSVTQVIDDKTPNEK